MSFCEIKRGEIYYINQYDACGSEQSGARPAIVVSNDMGNKYAPIITVVFLTTKKKKDLPTHVQIKSSRLESTALCEQVETVSKDRVGNYMGSCTSEEMVDIDQAVSVALGLGQKEETTSCASQEESVIALKTELDVYKRLYESLLASLIKQ